MEEQAKPPMKSKGFPVIPIIVLLMGISWLLHEAGVVTLNIPWLPLIVILFAISWLVDHYHRK